MDFSFFDSMAKQDAEEYLRNFLNTGSDFTQELIETANNNKIDADFTIDSVPIVLKCLLNWVKIISIGTDDSLPLWIKECDEHSDGGIEFDGPSRILILRGAYYLGKSFVSSTTVLSWATGNLETAVKNMPVVTGFVKNIEMAPLLVVENMFLKVLADGASTQIINEGIEFWQSLVPTR